MGSRGRRRLLLAAAAAAFFSCAVPALAATTEGFESGTLGTYTSVVPQCVPGGCGWAAATTAAHTGTFSAFAPDVSNISDQQLTLSQPFLVPAGSSTLDFWHRFALESTFDGGVLEYSTDNGTTWHDAGSLITFGGYTGTISANFLSPIAGRAAWTGTNGTSFTHVVVDTSSLAGQSVRFRFRLATDSSVASTGWWIDDVTLPADVTAPTATVTPPGPIAGPVTATFSEVVHGVNPGSFTLRVQGSSTTLPGTLTCKDAGNAVVDCDTGDVVKAILQPSSPLVPGQDYEAELNPAAATTKIADDVGNELVDATTPFRATTTSEEQSPAAVYAWRNVSNASASGGSYRIERLAKASASFTFTGTGVTWLTARGPDQGTAKVLIDGVSKGTVNNYAAGAFTLGVQRTFSGLSSGPHTIKIVVNGALGNAAGTDTRVVVDAFKVGSTLFPTPSAKYAWGEVSTASAYAGGEAVEDLAGASVKYTFRGTEIDWIGSTGPDRGKARVLIDGAFVATVDTYSPAATFKVVNGFGGLTDAVHTIEIRALGTKRAASTGTKIALDRFAIS